MKEDTGNALTHGNETVFLKGKDLHMHGAGELGQRHIAAGKDRRRGLIVHRDGGHVRQQRPWINQVLEQRIVRHRDIVMEQQCNELKAAVIRRLHLALTAADEGRAYYATLWASLAASAADQWRQLEAKNANPDSQPR